MEAAQAARGAGGGYLFGASRAKPSAAHDFCRGPPLVRPPGRPGRGRLTGPRAPGARPVRPGPAPGGGRTRRGDGVQPVAGCLSPPPGTEAGPAGPGPGKVAGRRPWRPAGRAPARRRPNRPTSGFPVPGRGTPGGRRAGKGRLVHADRGEEGAPARSPFALQPRRVRAERARRRCSAPRRRFASPPMPLLPPRPARIMPVPGLLRVTFFPRNVSHAGPQSGWYRRSSGGRPHPGGGMREHLPGDGTALGTPSTGAALAPDPGVHTAEGGAPCGQEGALPRCRYSVTNGGPPQQPAPGSGGRSYDREPGTADQVLGQRGAGSLVPAHQGWARPNSRRGAGGRLEGLDARQARFPPGPGAGGKGHGAPRAAGRQGAPRRPRPRRGDPRRRSRDGRSRKFRTQAATPGNWPDGPPDRRK